MRCSVQPFAKARAMRPQIVGAALQTISKDPEVATMMFEILELEKVIEGNSDVVIIPPNRGLLADVLTAQDKVK